MALADIDVTWSRSYVTARREGRVGGNASGAVWKDGKAADSTIRREVAILKAAANHALKFRRITVADMPSIELPKIKSTKHDGVPDEGRFFSREQIALLIFNAHGEMRDMIKLAYYTGARRASIENITVGQIDFARKKINLATPGKRQTKKRQAIVPLFDVLRADLARLTAGKKPTDRLFDAHRFYHAFNLTCRALDFDAPHHPHMIRHSRATHLLQDGKKMYAVAALLGDTVVTVEANYGHHSSNDLKDDLE